jgi:iron complex outermembrane receptor protein
VSRDNVNNTGRGTGPTLPGRHPRPSTASTCSTCPVAPAAAAIDGMGAYDEVLWASPAAKFGCAWDTGRAAVLQQPVKNTNVWWLRGTLAPGRTPALRRIRGRQGRVGQDASRPTRSAAAPSTSSPFYNLAYPSTGASYNAVFNALVGTFPHDRGQPRTAAGLPLALPALRQRAQIDTESDTSRLLLAADGPLGGGWDYRAGVSQRQPAKHQSLLGGGYFYGKEFAALINTGVLNPFLPAGQSQTPEALAALAATSANGVTLYGGKYTLQQADAVATGPLFKLPAGDAMAAVGLDMRTEKYRFNGNETDLETQRRIFNAPFDSINSMDTVKRDIKAVYTELMLPVTKNMEVTLAARRDDYTGFGDTTNPKVSLRLQPVASLVLRGSYNTGFRVPTFNQMFFGITESTYSGKDLVDPARCASGKVDPAVPGCESITPVIYTGGKRELGPEESKQWTGGFVWAPSADFSIGADWWSIRRTGTIQALSLSSLVNNYTLFPANFLRDPSGTLVAIDQRWVNAGESITKGVDLSIRGSGRIGAGSRWAASLEGSYLIEKKSRLVASAPMGASEVGVFTRAGDLGLRWKHALTGVYTRGPWTATLVQQYRSGYKDAVLPGVANGSVTPPDWKPDVDAYTLYHASVGYTGIKNLGITFGVRNLLDKDPPFSAAYDSNTGAGSSWEPRVADPRGRSFTLTVDYKFF